MSKPPEFATTFFKNLRSILVGHFGLQSVSYRFETPCSLRNIQKEANTQIEKQLSVKKSDLQINVGLQPFESQEYTIWRPCKQNYVLIRNSLRYEDMGQQSYPSYIYSWSIGHILEHEFFCLGHFAVLAVREKKWI